MPFNLIKTYNQLLEIAHLAEHERRASLLRIFKRDIEDNENLHFRGKKINPIKGEDIPMHALFRHLTTEIINEKTRERNFEIQRSVRLHWVKHHIEELKQGGVLIFSSQDTDGVRTYIFDEEENYVIVLLPYRSGQEYFLLTAYYLDGRNPKKIANKYKRRLPDIA